MKRYLINFDTDKMQKTYSDVLIIGSGIAGVYTALELDESYSVNIITKEEVEISNSVLAQGGIAVSLDKNDSPEEHMKDTLFAGAGLCEEESVSVLVHEAAENIGRICRFGVQFDRSTKDASQLALTREAAHSKNRIIHAGDATGKEVCDKLIHTAMLRKNINIIERIWALDLLVSDNTCKGALVYDENENVFKIYYAALTVCASGGYGQLYSHTTNPEVATGDGVALAVRAGANIVDMEFVQFHPTVLYHEHDRSFLISEAVRGEGAVLRNDKGERFMPNYHSMCELAPRDVVSRSIFSEMKKTNATHVYLDITAKSRDYLEKRFPTIFAKCLEYGIDISKDFIPVAPAEHYCMGGIKTGLYGDTGIKGFYACGEAACTGIHGANRLASNSLLEGLVFGNRIGFCAKEAVKREGLVSTPRFVSEEYAEDCCKVAPDTVKADICSIKETMTRLVGIVRNKEDLSAALDILNGFKKKYENALNYSTDMYILQSSLIVAIATVKAAITRQESRGAHFRQDYPETDDKSWRRHIVMNMEDIQ